MDKLKEASGNNETETLTLNDRNDKSAVSGGIFSRSGEEDNTNQCPIKEMVCKYYEEKGKTVHHKVSELLLKLYVKDTWQKQKNAHCDATEVNAWTSASRINQ